MDEYIALKTKISNIGDIKGDVYNLELSDLDIYELPIFYRKKDVAPDGHFHKGDDKSLDPQRVVVIKGRLSMAFEDLEGNSFNLDVSKGEMVQIPKFVFHSYTALEDTIFLEIRLNKYISSNPDRYLRKDFDSLLNL